MPLLKNTSQPFFPDPNSPAVRNCNGEYCYPFNFGDIPYQQWYQTPCGNNEIADPSFTALTLGAEMITNGTFTGSAASWTLSGNWAYGTNNAVVTAGVISELEQSGIGVVASQLYRVTFDMTRTAGALYVAVDAGPGTAASAFFNESGSYSVDLYNGVGPVVDKIRFITDVDFAGTIDNVSMKPVTLTSWVANSNWSFSDNLVCSSGTGINLLTESVANYITANKLYRLKYTVSNYISGSVTPYIANAAGTTQSSNGDYIVYLTPTATGVVSFAIPTGFIGCISNVDLRELRNDYLFEVINSSGTRFDISGYIEYYEDFVTLNVDVFSALEVSYGCYTIEVTDRCLVEGNNLVTDGTFALGTFTNWIKNNGNGQYDITGGDLDFIFEPLEGAQLVTNGDFTSGGAGWTAAGWTIGTGATHNIGNSSPLSRSVTIGTPAVAPNVLVSWIQLTITGRTAGYVTVTLSNSTYATQIATNEVWTVKLIPTIGGVVTLTITPTSAFDGTIDDIKLYQSTQPWSEYVLIRNTANVDYVTGNYTLTYAISNNTRVADISVGGGIQGQGQSLVYNKTIAAHSDSIINYVPGGQAAYFVAKFTSGGNYFPGRIGIDNVVAVRVEPFDATYTSECLNFQLEHDNTYLVTGTCDQPAFGFDFANTGFKLQMRFEVRGLNPVHDKAKNIQEFGTGNARIAYAQSTKKWQLVTAFMSESAHDAFSTIIDCDHFSLGVSEASAIEYVADAEDYQPQWFQNGTYSLAPATITIRLKTGGQKYNRHT